MPWPAKTDFDVRAYIKDVRQRLGLSQSGLALKLRVTASTVARWEQGKLGPSEESLRKLRALDRRESKNKAA